MMTRRWRLLGYMLATLAGTGLRMYWLAQADSETQWEGLLPFVAVVVWWEIAWRVALLALAVECATAGIDWLADRIRLAAHEYRIDLDEKREEKECE